jgi:hypothetical protein
VVTGTPQLWRESLKGTLLPRSKNLLLNFGTTWSHAIQRSDPTQLLGNGPSVEPFATESSTSFRVEIFRRPSKRSRLPFVPSELSLALIGNASGKQCSGRQELHARRFR